MSAIMKHCELSEEERLNIKNTLINVRSHNRDRHHSYMDDKDRANIDKLIAWLEDES